MPTNGFKPGNNMNPNGRPKGSGSRQKFFREMVEPRKDKLINKALELAESGNEAMLRLFLERMLPVKHQPESLQIKGETPSGTIDNLLEYMNTGDLTPDDASKIAAIVHKDAEIINQEIMIGKLSSLETKLDATNKANINLNTESIGSNDDGKEMDK